jgi:hypothetical protein
MQRKVWSDRRQDEQISKLTLGVNRRERERRGHQRRELARLNYPPASAPKVLNSFLCVTDISQKGIKFICKKNCEECIDPLTLKSVLKLTIQFHDGEVIDIKVDIIRCEHALKTHEKTYAGIIKNEISAKRIAKEQAYLLSHFTDFCKVTYNRSEYENLKVE